MSTSRDRRSARQIARDHATQIANARDVTIIEGTSVALLRPPFLAPAPPPHYVTRSGITSRLKQALIAVDEGKACVLGLTAIHGLPGIGKSALAAALCSDEAVLKRFPDGILWATLGQHPEILPLQMGWIQALGDYEYKPATPSDALSNLRSLLHDRKCLLVVDDAWSVESAEPFLAGGPMCRVLITTREILVARACHAELHLIDVMTEGEAIQLIRNRLGEDLGKEDLEQAQNICRLLGNLPLAVELASIKRLEGLGWNDLRRELSQELQRLAALDVSGADEVRDEAVRKRLSVVASFNLSIRTLSESLLAAFAWLGALPEDAVVDERVAATLWGCSEPEARKTLVTLGSKALIAPVAVGLAKFHIHDLLHDYARQLLSSSDKIAGGEGRGLGIPIREAHARLLQRYRRKSVDGAWHTVPDDGYAYAHLAWHMQEAGDWRSLEELLSGTDTQGRNGWFSVQESRGQTAQFLADVNRLRLLAMLELDRSDPAAAATAVLNCALLVASVSSVAKFLLPEFMALLVERGIWTPAQGLAYVRQVPDEVQQAGALVWLAESLTPFLVREAIVVATSITDSLRNAEALDALARRLIELNEPSLAVSCVQLIASSTRRAISLSALLEILPPEERRCALEEVLCLLDSSARELDTDRVMLFLAPRARSLFSDIERSQARSDHQASWSALERHPAWQSPSAPKPFHPCWKDQDTRRRILTEPRVGNEDASSMHKRFASAVRDSIGMRRAAVTTRMAKALPNSMLLEALPYARLIGDSSSIAEFVQVLAGRLPQDRWAPICSFAQQLGDPVARITALVPLLPSMNEGQREQILIGIAGELPSVLPLTPENAFPLHWLFAEIARISPQKATALAREATHQALKSNTQGRLFWVLSAALPHLEEHSREWVEIFPTLLRQIRSANRQMSAIELFADSIPGSIVDEVIDIAARGTVNKDVSPWPTIALLLPHASVKKRAALLWLANSYPADSLLRVQSLSVLLPYFDQARAAWAKTELRRSLRAMKLDEKRVRAMLAVMRFTRGALRLEMAGAALQLLATTEIRPEEVARHTRGVLGQLSRDEAVALMGVVRAEELTKKVRAAGSTDAMVRLRALAGASGVDSYGAMKQIIPTLSPGDIPEAIAVVKCLTTGSKRACLFALSSCAVGQEAAGLSTTLAMDALREVAQQERMDAEDARDLLFALSELPEPLREQLWLSSLLDSEHPSLLWECSKKGRPALMQVLPGFIFLMPESLGRRVLPHLLDALHLVLEWWP